MWWDKKVITNTKVPEPVAEPEPILQTNHFARLVDELDRSSQSWRSFDTADWQAIRDALVIAQKSPDTQEAKP